MMSERGPSGWKHARDIALLPFTVACIIPWLIHQGPSRWIPDHVLLALLGVAFLLAGLLLFAYTVRQFMRQGRGTLAPWTPTQRLIITGPYRYCRNPMISGVLFVLIGETVLLRSTAIGLEAAVFFLVNTLYFIFKEEPDMLRRFGEEYRVYRSTVPRWLPRPRSV